MREIKEIDGLEDRIHGFIDSGTQDLPIFGLVDLPTCKLAISLTRLLAHSSPGEVVNTDNREVFPLLPDGSIDLILTDPPYKNYRSNRPVANPKLPPILESDFDIPFFLEQSARVLKPGGHFYCWCDHRTFPGLVNELNRLRERSERQKCSQTSRLTVRPRRQAGHLTPLLEYRDCLIWVKNNHGPGNLKLWAPQHEFLLFASKGKAQPLQGGRKPNVLFKRNGKEIQFYKKISNYKFNHGTTKPVEILEMIIQAASEEGDLVLDPYAGSMSTAEACIKTGRRYLMVELVQAYYDTGMERIRRLREGG
ncbi:MAG: site-specific DNA-methyltransferase [Calditrichota bacterium]